MGKARKSVWNRLMATVLSAVMVLGLLPISFSDVFAATEEHPNAVTITVNDLSGPVYGAKVTYSIVDAPAIGDVSDVGIEYELDTEKNGCVVVLPKEDYLDHLLLYAKIEKAGYVTKTIETPISSDQEDFPVELILQTTGITASPVNVDANGKQQNLVEISGADTYTVTYYINDNEIGTTTAMAKDPGVYKVKVHCEKTGYESKDFDVTSVIRYSDGFDPGTLYTEKNYDGNTHDVCNKNNFYFTESNLQNATDGKIYMSLNKKNAAGTWDTIPSETKTVDPSDSRTTVSQVKDAGSYQLVISLKNAGQDVLYQKSFAIEIYPASLSEIDSSIRRSIFSTYSGRYDGLAHDVVTNLVTLKNSYPNYSFMFSIDGGKTWTNDCQVKYFKVDAYEFKVKVATSDGNYSTTYTLQAYVNFKGTQTINFTNTSYIDGKSTTIDLETAKAAVIDFSITGGSTDETATYSISRVAGELRSIDQIASINTAGELEVKNPGSIIVTATQPGDSNWNSQSISFTLHVQTTGMVAFQDVTDPETAIAYTLGTNWKDPAKENVSQLKATSPNTSDHGEVTYSIDQTDVGLTCDSYTGALWVSDRDKLYKTLKTGALKVKVTANKAATDIYTEASAYYYIELSLLDAPTEAYTLTGTNGANGWYTSDVTVTPSSEYKISFGYLSSTFYDNVLLNTSGVNSYVVYLRHTNGGITKPITIQGIKIDTKDPQDMQITLSEPYNRNEDATKYYYNVPLIVKLQAKNEISGLVKFDWTYTGEVTEAGAKPVKLTGSITEFTDENGYTTATVTLPASGEQLRGTISFTATKNNGKSYKIEESTTVIYDTTKPDSLVSMNQETQTVDERLYYNREEGVTFTVAMTEANFESKDVNVMLYKDEQPGVEIPAENITWTDTGIDTYSGVFSVSGDGDYRVEISYTDRSGNVMKTYISPDFTIDLIKPEVSIQYDSETNSATVTVIENNFRRDDINFKIVSTNILGEAVKTNIDAGILRTCEWTRNGDTNTAVITGFSDAIYALTVDYYDLAMNQADTASIKNIIVDTKGPVIVPDNGVTYSESILEKVLQTVTFGFYNPSVTVTFTATDKISGVDYFDWEYVSKEQNGEEDLKTIGGRLKATKNQDVGTASMTLTADEAKQFCGSIIFTATDKKGNLSKKFADDNRVIVVDTISPTMNVEYGPADRSDNGDLYYKGSVPVKLSVTEANFYAENIRVTASRDGGKDIAITPVWTDASTKETPDLHIGTFTLAAPADQSADGDYVITIRYGDYSGNQMTGDVNIESGVYTSGRITIDTLAPVVNVSYSNTNAVNVTKDPKGNDRSYFASLQTATISVNEHNFKAEEVQFIVAAEDISGKALDLNSYLKKGEWVSEGDLHTIVFTYPGDANYTFDLEYTDTATNVMIDRPVDYFTVDKTVPENLSIAYSESVLDTILENISFGFYNAKTTVTITADDSVSGVFGINYNGNQTSQNVKYSNNNKTATTEFELPGSSSDAQYDGYVDFNVQDRSGNKTGTKDEKRIIVDSISPTASVTYTKPALAENQVSYFDKPIQGEITIKEANFYAKDVSVRVSKDGEPATALETNWSNADKDTHIGTFTLSEDGIYVVSISYTDNSKNAMTDYTSQIMTLDTTIEKPVIKINGKTESGRAYRDNVIPAISCEDVNFSKYEITLTRTNFGTKNADVKDLFIKNMKETATGASGSFDTFEVKQENDGIYKMTVSVQDKAGNSATASTVFTVNRFGSVYEYSDYLASLVENGGAYVSSITEDLIITEYNPDQILEDSLQIEVTRDGKPVSDLVFSSSEVNNEITASEDGGWYQYQYSIGKDNFTQDGVYKVSVSTIDATGNTMENNKAAGQAIIFYVDNAAPEITSVLGLENEIIDATKQDVRYTVYDTIGLKSVQVFINGAANGSPVTDFSGDINNYTGSFTMTERGEKQAVRIVVEDLAGNITDTDASTFKSAFSFRKYVTISTNFFVRWYANSPLFWGSMVGIVALTGALVALVVSRRRRPRRKH